MSSVGKCVSDKGETPVWAWYHNTYLVQFWDDLDSDEQNESEV